MLSTFKPVIASDITAMVYFFYFSKLTPNNFGLASNMVFYLTTFSPRRFNIRKELESSLGLYTSSFINLSTTAPYRNLIDVEANKQPRRDPWVRILARVSFFLSRYILNWSFYHLALDENNQVCETSN